MKSQAIAARVKQEKAVNRRGLTVFKGDRLKSVVPLSGRMPDLHVNGGGEADSCPPH